MSKRRKYSREFKQGAVDQNWTPIFGQPDKCILLLLTVPDHAASGHTTPP